MVGVLPVIDLTQYVFEALRRDEESILYRCRRREDRSQVLMLSPALQKPALEGVERLQHEYSLREELDPNWAARPIAIVRLWDRTVLVLEDPGGVPLEQLQGQPLDLALSLFSAD